MENAKCKNKLQTRNSIRLNKQVKLSQFASTPISVRSLAACSSTPKIPSNNIRFELNKQILSPVSEIRSFNNGDADVNDDDFIVLLDKENNNNNTKENITVLSTLNEKNRQSKSSENITAKVDVILKPLKEKKMNQAEEKIELQTTKPLVSRNDPYMQLVLNNNNNKKQSLQVRIADIRSCAGEEDHLEVKRLEEIRVTKTTTTTTSVTSVTKVKKVDLLKNFLQNSVKTQQVVKNYDENLILVKKPKLNPDNDILKKFLLENNGKKKN
jgi:hypothetical protein